MKGEKKDPTIAPTANAKYSNLHLICSLVLD
jgi:hypothetical protein